MLWGGAGWRGAPAWPSPGLVARCWSWALFPFSALCPAPPCSPSAFGPPCGCGAGRHRGRRGCGSLCCWLGALLQRGGAGPLAFLRAAPGLAAAAGHGHTSSGAGPGGALKGESIRSTLSYYPTARRGPAATGLQPASAMPSRRPRRSGRAGCTRPLPCLAAPLLRGNKAH